MAFYFPASTIEVMSKLEAVPAPDPEPTLEELKAKAACYDWLISGQRIRQGIAVPNFGVRRIDKNAESSLLSFTYWCSPEQLTAAIQAEIAKG